LRQLVKAELDKATDRVEEFERLNKTYVQGGREDIAAVMRKNAKAGERLMCVWLLALSLWVYT
jgi:hypothetical protein